MKKTSCLLLTILLFLLLLTGCGQSSSEPLLQESPLQDGEEIAVMETSLGVIKLRFFPEQAPIGSGKLPYPRQRRLLRRRYLPPGHRRFHDPGR